MIKLPKSKFHIINLVTIFTFLIVIITILYLFIPEKTTQFKTGVFPVSKEVYSPEERVTLYISYCRDHTNTVDITYELIGETYGIIDTKNVERSRLSVGCKDDFPISWYIIPHRVKNDVYYLQITLDYNTKKFYQPTEQYRTESFLIEN